MLTVEQLRGAAPLPDPLPIGERLSALFAARVRALDADAQTVLLLAAAERLGDPRLLRRAADAIGEVSWDEAIAKAEASGLVTFTPAVEFRHPLVRSAIYYAASAADRRRAHAALAGALDAEGDADRRAWHLGAAADGPDEAVARALEASADRARQRGGSSAAALYLWRAAELTPDPERAAERLLEAARAELVGARGPRARDMLGRARANGLAERHRAEAAWTEALVHIVDGTVREPAALMADALPLVGAHQRALAVGASVAGEAAALAGGHLVEASIRTAVAAGTLAVIDRCHIPDPIAQVAAGIATALSGERVAAVAMLRAGHDRRCPRSGTSSGARRSQRPCRVLRHRPRRGRGPRRPGLGGALPCVGAARPSHRRPRRAPARPELREAGSKCFRDVSGRPPRTSPRSRTSCRSRARADCSGHRLPQRCCAPRGKETRTPPGPAPGA